VRPPYRFVSYQALGTFQLFDHSSDPREQLDVAEENAELVAEMQASIESYLAMSNDDWQAPSIQIDEMRLHQLRALGYSIPEVKGNKQGR